MEGLLDPNREMKKVMVLDLSGILNIDTTGLEAPETLHGMLAKRSAKRNPTNHCSRSIHATCGRRRYAFPPFEFYADVLKVPYP